MSVIIISAVKKIDYSCKISSISIEDHFTQLKTKNLLQDRKCITEPINKHKSRKNERFKEDKMNGCPLKWIDFNRSL